MRKTPQAGCIDTTSCQASKIGIKLLRVLRQGSAAKAQRSVAVGCEIRKDLQLFWQLQHLSELGARALRADSHQTHPGGIQAFSLDGATHLLCHFPRVKVAPMRQKEDPRAVEQLRSLQSLSTSHLLDSTGCQGLCHRLVDLLQDIGAGYEDRQE